jgi:hypothetical protein
MAFTVAVIDKTVVGNKRQVALSCTADANSGVIDTTLSSIDGFSVSVVSAATNGQNFKRNIAADGSASPGKIMASSCANGEDFFIIAYGR